MEVLIEAFPVVFGVLLGITCARSEGLRKHLLLWGVGGIALGCFATLASGEWQISPLYFLFDMGLVLIVSLITAVALDRIQKYKGPR